MKKDEDVTKTEEDDEKKKEGFGPVVNEEGLEFVPRPFDMRWQRGRSPSRRDASEESFETVESRSGSRHNKIKAFNRRSSGKVSISSSSSDSPRRDIDSLPKLPPPASADERPPASPDCIAAALNEGADHVRPPARKN